MRDEEFSRKQVGDRGEAIAAAFLEGKGYEIVARNFRWRLGELDIVARQGDLLVFVEVKSQYRGGFGPPETWVTPKKQRRVSLAARRFLQVNEIEDVDCRFDVIAVTFGGKEPQVRHIENAFWTDPDVAPPGFI